MNTITLETAWIRDKNPHGAVILGYLVERSKEADKEGWFTATFEDFTAITGMHPTTYRLWRSSLENEGILETERSIPGQNRYRLHLDKNHTSTTNGVE